MWGRERGRRKYNQRPNATRPASANVICSIDQLGCGCFGPRKLIKNRASFPKHDAAMKRLYLGLCDIATHWKTPIQNWKHVTSQLMIRFENCFAPAQQNAFT